MLRLLRRRGWLLPLVAVAVAAAGYAVATLRPVTYSAEAIGVVLPSTLRTPAEAERLAVTYSALIPSDTATALSVARALRTTTSDVQNHTSVTNNGTDALLHLDYRANTASQASAGATALLAAVAGPNPSSPNIAPRSIGTVVFPNHAASSGGVAELTVIGAILGIFLGALLISAWERSDPRVDDVDALASEVACPVSSLDGMSDAAVCALIERWMVLAGGSRVRIALLPVTERLAPRMSDIANRLATAGQTHGAIVLSRASSDVSAEGNGQTQGLGSGEASHKWTISYRERRAVELVVGPPPGETSGGELVAITCDLTILIVERGTSHRQVWTAFGVLTKFGISPGWAILARRKRTSRRKVSPQTAARSEEVGSAVEVSVLQ